MAASRVRTIQVVIAGRYGQVQESTFPIHSEPPAVVRTCLELNKSGADSSHSAVTFDFLDSEPQEEVGLHAVAKIDRVNSYVARPQIGQGSPVHIETGQAHVLSHSEEQSST